MNVYVNQKYQISKDEYLLGIDFWDSLICSIFERECFWSLFKHIEKNVMDSVVPKN